MYEFQPESARLLLHRTRILVLMIQAKDMEGFAMAAQLLGRTPGLSFIGEFDPPAYPFLSVDPGTRDALTKHHRAMQDVFKATLDEDDDARRGTWLEAMVRNDLPLEGCGSRFPSLVARALDESHGPVLSRLLDLRPDYKARIAVPATLDAAVRRLVIFVDPGLLDVMLKAGLDINAPIPSSGMTILQRVVKFRPESIGPVTAVIERGADPGARGCPHKYPHSPLAMALQCGLPDIARELMKHGARMLEDGRPVVDPSTLSDPECRALMLSYLARQHACKLAGSALPADPS